MRTSDKDLEENRNLILNQDLEGLLRKNQFLIVGMVNKFYPPNSERNDYMQEARIGVYEAMISHDINNKGWAGYLRFKILNRLFKYQETQTTVRVSKYHRYVKEKDTFNPYFVDSLDNSNELTNEPMYAGIPYDGRPYDEFDEPVFDMDAEIEKLFKFVEDNFDETTNLILYGRMYRIPMEKIGEELGINTRKCHTLFNTLIRRLEKKYKTKIGGYIFRLSADEKLQLSRDLSRTAYHKRKEENNYE